ncbi:3-oxoacyl-[acyl-carrier-protein] synthase III C-terminal domain-containing protein [Streptomyces cellulosae]|uniref:3-oxoacyl-[acyl-carrier-protein] synthase III C-terminal domain-containing protein n=1 Tax=Streptomyces cellulosae TaxID=1968 RepID=UPI0004CABBBF|nr:3-oxoacyl-[acyl-carrier-protein] synthase III C-terminal domain-containing protein [Streptomyces cellulosae]
MRFPTPLRIAASALWLPERREAVADAVRAGRIEPDRAARNAYTEIPVSDLAPPQMAVRAGRTALAESGVAAEDVGLLVHAWTYYQGQDYWQPVHYIINELELPNALPLGVDLGCNGGFAALEVMACRLLCDPATHSAVLTTAERFAPPRFDRWSANFDAVYGDAATALVLDRERGGYEVLSTASKAAPEFEIMYRGSTPWGTGAFQHRPKVDIRATLVDFLASGGGQRFAAVAGDAVRSTVTSALEQAGIAMDDARVRVIAPPRFGAELIDRSYISVLAGLTKAEVLNLGARTGHLGAGDMAANLADITAAGRLQPGEIGVLLSATAGFSWSCMVLRAV